MDLRSDAGRQELGRRIQSAIAEAGFTSLPAFADELGCSRALIYQYISGDVLVQLDRLSAIAEITGKPIDWFFVNSRNGLDGEIAQLTDEIEQLRNDCDELERTLARERGGRISESDAARRSLLEVLQELCRVQRRTGEMHALATTAARCADLARALGDDASLAIAHLQSGHAAFALGERDAAEQSVRSALTVAERIGQAGTALSARQELVRVLQASGHLDEARSEALQIAAGDAWWGRWAGLVAVAAIDEQCGQLAAAGEALEQAERIIDAPSTSPERARIASTYVLSNRVNVMLARGDYVEARAAADRLHDLAAEAGLPDQMREATLNRAIATLRLGELEQAHELLSRLAEWAEISGDRRLAGLASIFEGERLVEAGDPAEARRLALDAIELGNGVVSGQIVAEAERVLGAAYLADGMVRDALHHLKRCRDRAERLKLRRVSVAAQLQQARALVAADDGTAGRVLSEALREAQQCEYSDLIDEAHAIIEECHDKLADETDAGGAEEQS